MKRYISKMMSILLVAVTACTDRLEPDFVTGVAGQPAEISVRLEQGDVSTVSRSDISEGLDRKITSIWVATYSIDGTRTGVYKATGLNETMTPHSTARTISLKTRSGQSYIVAVANFEHRFGANDNDGETVSLAEALDAATTWDEFLNLSCAFDREGGASAEAPLNALVMSGSYVSGAHVDGSRTSPETVNITAGTNTLKGSIHLRRTVSQVVFNVSHNTTNIGRAEIVSWRVVNLPAAAWLFERADNEADINCPDVRATAGNRFHTSNSSNNVTSHDDGFSFDFWQLENRRRGLPVPAEFAANPYLYREREFKSADGLNTRVFRSLTESAENPGMNNYATYVEFTVSLDLLRDETGKPLNMTRKAEATYRVHLGYCEGSSTAERARDFMVRRNTHYTYNVRINNVNDIIVEATGQEVNPGVEGSVSDVSHTFKQLDAHYSVMNIELTESNLNGFRFTILCYDENGREVRIVSDDASSIPAEGSERFKYLNWIELRKTKGENVIADYQPRSKNATNTEKTLLLTDMGAHCEPGWYTMFINEYVYEDSEDEAGSTNWHGYVNMPDRRAWLNVVGDISDDKMSSHNTSKYAISQSSIQTYYTTTSASTSAIGVEHVNESFGLNLRNNFNNPGKTVGISDLSGRYNTAQFLNGETSNSLNWKDNSISWSKFLETDAFQHINAVNNQNIIEAAHYEPLQKIRTVAASIESNSLGRYDPDQTASAQYIQAITACLNRNRDLDGDGKIDATELRWVVPSSRQCIRMILGRNSLPTPLFDPTDVDRLPTPDLANNGLSSSLLMYASDGKMIWLMEGTSTSKWREWPSSCAAPWQIRCVRSLGQDLKTLSANQSASRAFYRREGTNIIDLSAYNPRSLREKVDGPLPVHHINDQNNNRCYRAFEFSPEMYSLTHANIGLNGKTIEWSSYLAEHNPCDYLNKDGQSGWRVPNQKELSILGLLGITGSGVTYQLSCTYSYYRKDGYGFRVSDETETLSSETRIPMMIVTDTGAGTQPWLERLNQVKISGNTWGLRCVRDCE